MELHDHEMLFERLEQAVVLARYLGRLMRRIATTDATLAQAKHVEVAGAAGDLDAMRAW